MTIITDDVLDEHLTQAHKDDGLDYLKPLYENSPRTFMLLLLMTSEIEIGNREDCFEAAVKRLDAAIAKTEAATNPEEKEG